MQREPGSDRVKAEFEVDGEDVTIRTDLELMCTRSLLEEQTLQVTERKKARSAVGPALGLTGLGIMTLVLAHGQLCRQRDPESGRVEPCLGPFYGFGLATGFGLSVAGLTVTGVQELRRKESRSTHVRVVPVQKETTVCSRSSAIGSLVEIEFVSGLRFGGRIDGNGDAHVHVPAAVWEGRGTAECRIFLDGKEIRKAILRQIPKGQRLE